MYDAVVANGGAQSACGWVTDKWGLSWQITPRERYASRSNMGFEAARRQSHIA